MKKKHELKKGYKAKSTLREWAEAIIVAAFCAMVIRTFIIQAFRIPTGSMRPTLLEGDVIMVNKFIYGARIPFTDFVLPKFRDPLRGDVIVFIYPQNPKKDFIKRLVAVEGETVEIKNGTIYINAKPLLEPPFNQFYYYNRGEFAQEEAKVMVPKDHYFVLGDNSASSQDSRYWGFVPRKNVLGKALFIYWPPKRVRMIR